MEKKRMIPGHDASKTEFIKWYFDKKGITLRDFSQEVLNRQSRYYPSLTIEECDEAVRSVLQKRELQHTLLVAINLDVLCEKGQLLGPLQRIVFEDRGTFGVDELLINSASLYGSIGLSNAFALDQEKPGIIGKLDKEGKQTGACNTFMDDLACVIIACAIGKLAHQNDHSRGEDETNGVLFD